MMKNLLMFLALALIPYRLCAHQPSISLNPQDVPIFYGNNPLTGLEAFTLLTSLPLKNPDEKKIVKSIENGLKKLGEVTHLKDTDLRGFGAGNLLLIQIGPVRGADGSDMPLTRISLSIETPTTLDKTGLKTFPMVWSINTFLPGKFDAISQASLIQAIQKLTADFVSSYESANQGQPKKPIFYTYN
jgi:hypothetical protein